MQVTFSENKKYVLFVHDDIKEYKALANFPAFVRVNNYHACEAIQPIVHNVIERCKKSFRKILVSQLVTDWLNTPFKLKTIPESFKFYTTPEKFQSIALRFLYTLGSAGILLDPGMGKSKVILDYIALARFNKSVIVCPAPLLFVWQDEILKHRPDLSYYAVASTDWEAEAAGIKTSNVTIINYTKAVIFKHRLKEVGFQFIHLDEFLIKDPKTDRTKALTEIGKTIPYRAGGSGTLINNSPMDAFCPSRFLQPSLVGWNYTSFLDKYSVQKQTKDESGNPGRKMVVAFKGIKEVKSILESCSIVMTKEEWLKLPEKHFHDSYTQMGEDQREAYYNLMRNYRLEVKTATGVREIEVNNPLVMLSKLYQISQGFMYFYKEDPKEIVDELLAQDLKPKKKKKSDREVHFFKDQPKIAILRKLLENELKNKKSIIWFNLDGEFELIRQLLDQMNAEGASENYLYIKGGDGKIGEKVREFNKNPNIKRLVCQSKSVNYGITVLGTTREILDEEGVEVLPSIDPSVHVEVFYSVNFSLEVYLQQIDRIHRLGQKHDCHYYRIFVNNPVEIKLRESISDKMYLKKEMMVDVAKSLLQQLSDVVSEKAVEEAAGAVIEIAGIE